MKVRLVAIVLLVGFISFTLGAGQDELPPPPPEPAVSDGPFEIPPLVEEEAEEEGRLSIRGADPGCFLSAEDRAISDEEIEVFDLLNQYRVEHDVPTVGWSLRLGDAAAWQVRDMGTDPTYFSHTDRYGRDPGQRINACGFDNPYTWRGENLAWGQPTPDDAMTAWKGSSGHNALMLDPKYIAYGGGHVLGATANLWAMVFASAFDSQGEYNLGGPDPTPTKPPTAPADCTVDPGELGPSPEEQNLLNTINQYRAVDYLWSNALSRAAVWMAHDNATRGLEDNHTDSLGRGLRQRATDCGYPEALPVGENTTAGLTYADGGFSTLSEWMFAQADWANVVGTAYTHAGIARAYSPFSPYVWHWVLVVGRESAASPTSTMAVPTSTTTAPTGTPTLVPTQEPVTTLTPTQEPAATSTTTPEPATPTDTPPPTATLTPTLTPLPSPTIVPTATATATIVPTIITGAGLVGNYFPNVYLSGAPLQRIDPGINFIWGNGSPMEGIPPDYFSVRWEGWIFLPVGGTWSFITNTDDGVALWLDGSQVVYAWQNKSNYTVTGRRTVPAGWHRFRMQMFEAAGQSQAVLRVAPPGGLPYFPPPEHWRTP